jgi:hypothetical protein
MNSETVCSEALAAFSTASQPASSMRKYRFGICPVAGLPGLRFGFSFAITKFMSTQEFCQFISNCVDKNVAVGYYFCVDNNTKHEGRKMTPREERGLILAARSRGIKRKGNLWSVPSQQENHDSYLVNLKVQTCTCLDHQEGGHKCKHIYAAEIVYQREFELFRSDQEIGAREYLFRFESLYDPPGSPE